ncbi:hypothetical protein BKA67DRAFT_663850 [Truncatella angustata]|uniref:Uncharacterized protein n=1 Tax=Truncatella angustata TaxID=152316 RepID=A0A9P8UBF2_9PEZI|nr:uncharacterized protein BKA67DRAFT_663850 [Truncatella angustata]KAH6645977.1 hypothetical protein BKA67DRAFT_663850 [Truncatella angustata]
MNKNWGDRADKDLFFTILSVKNIGVISGAEWTAIGNHMRSMGYGFTNEGCRQHFQGLRRAQNKAETNGTVAESPRKNDPTLNPITRRPGPGRGRPRKQPLTPVENPGQDGAALTGVAGVPYEEEVQQQQLPLPPPPPPPPDAAPPVDDAIADDLPLPLTIPAQEPTSLELVTGEDDLDEQPAKRPRLDDPSDHLDDPAGLALDDNNVDVLVDHELDHGYFGEA